MPKNKKRHYNEHFAGEAMRMTEEHRLGGMLHDDMHAIANMPQNVIMRDYPREIGYLPENLDDTIAGVDAQMQIDQSTKMRHFKPKKV